MCYKVVFSLQLLQAYFVFHFSCVFKIVYDLTCLPIYIYIYSTPVHVHVNFAKVSAFIEIFLSLRCILGNFVI